ncbi:hypothetical protein MTO96_000987 [Rhipicephalus appendiculatus]
MKAITATTLTSRGHHRAHHGSVCSLPEQSLAAVVDCVVQNVTEEIRGKLERVKDGLECDTILCGIKEILRAGRHSGEQPDGRFHA